MRVLITGNMGYVGPSVVRRLRREHPDARIDGYDAGFFAHALTGAADLPEARVDRQLFADVRDSDQGLDLSEYDAVVLLAAVSNDPMGDRFAQVTAAINQDAAVAMAERASKAGVRNLVFASSCSVYGVASGPPRKEDDPLNPVTAYARSKIGTEEHLRALEGDMVVTCLRFATACGWSDRLRLDLVLNDFVACALAQGRITVLSDGTPWRPLIDTQDMATAIDWAVTRPAENGGRFLTVNVGSDDRNYQVAELAHAVVAAVPGATVDINTDAPADSRSYKVDFGLYARLAPRHQPSVTLAQSIDELRAGLTGIGFNDAQFRNSQLVRLKVLESHMQSGRLTSDLRWTWR